MATYKAVPKAWPWWLAFGVLVAFATAGLILVMAVNAKTISLAGDDDLVGHNDVVSARISFYPLASVPWGDAIYTLTFPVTAPGALAGSIHKYQTPTHFLITDKALFPNPGDFRIVYTGHGGYYILGPKPSGSLQKITPASVAKHAPQVSRANDADSAAFFGYGLLFFCLLVPAVVQSARRSRRLAPERAIVRAQAIAVSQAALAASHWRPDPSWAPPDPPSGPPPGSVSGSGGT
jgi:hypothetical protein